jgi:hypothetical protein
MKQLRKNTQVQIHVLISDIAYAIKLNTARFAPGFVNYKKGCTRFATVSDKVYQLLVHGRWFSLGTTASSTTKTGRHDTAEKLLIVALSKINQSITKTITLLSSFALSNITCVR